MQRTTIEWCRDPDGKAGRTWNPATGCLRGCRAPGAKKSYCYARRIAKRFGKTEAEQRFEPVFHQERLLAPYDVKKPSTILVGSMTDMLGNWGWKNSERELPSSIVVRLVQITITSNPQHTFLLLTKYPERYQQFNPWPTNCWLGASPTNGTTWWANQWHLSKAEWDDGKRRSYISLEPLLGPVIKMVLCPAPPPQWLIIGAQTGSGAKPPEKSWLAGASAYAKSRNIPIFFKDSVYRAGDKRELPYLEKA